MNYPCNHPNCLHSSLLGLRQGIYYGGRIRFFHALVMTMLFKEGTLSEKMTGIFQLTYEHARNLGQYVFIYKSIVCLLNKIRRRKSKLHNFLAGCIAGYVIFGRSKSSVNQQIVLYLLSRIIVGTASNLQRKGYLPKNVSVFPWLAALSWGFVMFLFENDPAALQSSLTQSMVFLYKSSNKPVTTWTQLIPLELEILQQT